MKKIIQILLTGISISFWSMKIYAQDPNLHIYLTFGQSNMEGVGTIEAQDRVSDSRVQVMGAVNCNAGGRSYTLGKWQTYSPPTVRCNTGLGPSDYFARTMTSKLPTNIKIGIVPVAIAGCDIALFDKANYAAYAATAPSYMVGTINAYGGNPYARLVEVAKLAQKDGVIKGILFHQGETNNTQRTWPAKVKAIYDNLIKDLALDPTKTPLLVGELVTTAQGGSCGAHNSIIATMPTVVTNSHVISAANLNHQGDNLHFSSASYRTLGQRYAEKMLTLLLTENAPVVSITAPLNNTSFTTLQAITISANASDADGNIIKVEFYDGNTLLGSDIAAPFTFTSNGMSSGVHTPTAKATDNAGLITTSVAISINVQGTQSPLKDALVIPGRIEAEGYDSGGEGIAFHEADALGNQGGATYRTDEVDIETTTDAGGAYNISYSMQGEWLEYSVNVKSAGSYELKLRTATNATGAAVHLDLDGNSLSGVINLPNTGGYKIWETVTTKVNLPQGSHIIRLVFDANYINMNYMEFSAAVISGTENGINNLIEVFPNPFTKQLHIQMPGKFTYELCNLSGQLTESGEAEELHEIKGNYLKGLYILKLIQGTTHRYVKVIQE